MTRVLVASGVVLSALLAAVLLWGRTGTPTSRQTTEETPVLQVPADSQVVTVQSHYGPAQKNEEPEQPAPAYTKLPVWFAMVPNEATARMGYYDRETQAFYAWKGVVVRAEQIPGFNSWFSRSDPLDIRLLKVTEVDPPPTHYLSLPDGTYAPGFYDGRVAFTFYRWKGIRLKKKQIPAEAFKKYVFPEGRKESYIIDPPQYARK